MTPQTASTVSTGQAARMLGVSAETVRDMVKDGRLKATRPGHHIRVAIADVNAIAKPQTAERRRIAAQILAGLVANPARAHETSVDLVEHAIELTDLLMSATE